MVERRPRVQRLAVGVLWLGVWQLASMLVGSSLLLAGPLETLRRLLALLVEERFLSVVCFSLARVGCGFLAAFATALVVAFVAHRIPLVARLLAPGVSVLKSVPIACVIVLLLIWVGSRQVSGIAVFIVVFPAVYFSCLEGLGRLEVELSEMLAVFRVRGVVRLLVHTWPQVLPYLVATSKNACGMAWKAGIAAELIGSPLGSIGERIYQAKILLETADLFAWTLVVMALSAVCERAFVTLLARSGDLSRRLALVLVRRLDTRRHGVVAPGPIELLGATIGYGGAPVGEGVSLQLDPGARVVLTDASGCGKTTLLRTLAGLQPLLSGPAAELPEAVTMVFQEARLVDELTAVQNVRLVAGGLEEPELRDALLELLDADALDVPVAELSGGQRRRVEIVRALMCPSAAVLLDEPFASLDEQTHRRAAAFVRRHLAGRTLVAASHAPQDAELLQADERRLFAR